MNSRPLNVYINPNSLSSSGSVHINKKVFNVNQNTLLKQPNTDLDDKSTIPDKIHYNPKFLKDYNQLSFKQPHTLSSVSNSNPKNIYVNPSFAQNFNFNSASIHAYSKSLDHQKNNSILDISPVAYTEKEFGHSVNPPSVYNENIDCENVNISNVTYTKDNSHQWASVDSKTSVESTSYNVLKHCQLSSVNKYRKVNNTVYPHETSKPSNYHWYRKSNNVPPTWSPAIVSPVSDQVLHRKPRLSGSFKKIGKRKLVRTSLIQRYIFSRRYSIPSMIQHSRHTIASKKKINKCIAQTKYKLINGSNAPVNETNVPSPMTNFIKIGKRKIVRKSILQSILEARRNRFCNPRKYYFNKNHCLSKEKNKIAFKAVRSRYKVIRNIASQKTSLPNISPDSSKVRSTFKIFKKKDYGNVSCFLKSKSILLRMPPSYRFQLRLEEKRNRMALLKKVNNRKKCLYYNRFGYCKGLLDGNCKKVHDPKSVAVCRKYLKGICDGEGCKLSHQVVPEKMPTCHQFLAGVCIRPTCPFLHVKLSVGRPICTDFLQGFCQNGNSCNKRHQFICPELDETGTCKVEKCPYPHPSLDVNKKVSNPPTLKPPCQSSKKSTPLSMADETSSPSEEYRNRYFSEENESERCIESSENNINANERKFDHKNGTNSVYFNESLLSFIPFS